MSRRPLGPWVWCRYCARWSGLTTDGACRSPYRQTTGFWSHELVRNIKDATLDAVGRKGWTRTEPPRIAAWPCAPRLTLLGALRRTLRLPIGENDE